MAKASPTIYDVARAAGVSIATVSRVLNEPQKVNDETRTAVLASIDRLGYVPKAEARARAMQQNRRIGVITPHFTAPSFVQRLRGVATAIRKTNYELVIYSVDSPERLTHYLETLPIIHYLDGLIILSLQFDDRFASRLVGYHMETVLIEYPHSTLSSIEIDDVFGGHLAAEYLYNKGYRHFGFVGDTVIPEFGVHPITLRLAGYRQKLKELQSPILDQDIVTVAYDVDATRRTMLGYLAGQSRPEAIFAATDMQAIGIMRAARELGLRVPQDLAIIGFDDIDVAEYMGLTTVRQHLDESGKIAAELLLSRINDPNRPVQHIHLPLNIIERDTA